MTEEFTKIILPESIKKPVKCEWCEKPLPKRHVTHKNIGQDPPEHKFCSRKCKEKWCHSERKKIEKNKKKKKK